MPSVEGPESLDSPGGPGDAAALEAVGAVGAAALPGSADPPGWGCR